MAWATALAPTCNARPNRPSSDLGGPPAAPNAGKCSAAERSGGGSGRGGGREGAGCFGGGPPNAGGMAKHAAARAGAEAEAKQGERGSPEGEGLDEVVQDANTWRTDGIAALVEK